MSTIDLDADTMNNLLKIFASRPGGPQTTFEKGHIVVRVKGLTLTAVVQLTTDGIKVNLGLVT